MSKWKMRGNLAVTFAAILAISGWLLPKDTLTEMLWSAIVGLLVPSALLWYQQLCLVKYTHRLASLRTRSRLDRAFEKGVRVGSEGALRYRNRL